MTDEEQSIADGFGLIWASSVGARDGFVVELHDDHDDPVAEVFRDDLREGELTFNTFADTSLPLHAVRWLLDVAAREMPPHTPDVPLD